MTYYRFSDGDVADFNFDPGDDAVQISKAEFKRAERDAARVRLRNLLPPNSTIYVVCMRKSATSTSYRVLISCGSCVIDITRAVALATGFRYNPDADTVCVGGLGLSRRFQLGYDLGRALYPDGAPGFADGGYAVGVAAT